MRKVRHLACCAQAFPLAAAVLSIAPRRSFASLAKILTNMKYTPTLKPAVPIPPHQESAWPGPNTRYISTGLAEPDEIS